MSVYVRAFGVPLTIEFVGTDNLDEVAEVLAQWRAADLVSLNIGGHTRLTVDWKRVMTYESSYLTPEDEDEAADTIKIPIDGAADTRTVLG